MKIDRRRKADRELYAKKVIEHNLDTRKAMIDLSGDSAHGKALDNKLNRWLSDKQVLHEISREYEALNLSQKDTKNILSAVLFKTVLKEGTKDSDVIQGALAQAKISGLLATDATTVNLGIIGSEGMAKILASYDVEGDEVVDAD